MDRIRGRRCRRLVVLVVVGMLALSLGTGVATAQSIEGFSGTIVVEEGETVGSVDGFAGSVIVEGTVTGDISGVAGQIHVTETGSVEGSIEGAAGTVRIDGTVGGELNTAAGHTELTETSEIGGEVHVGGGYVGIDGTVGDNVRVGAGTIEVGPNADITGELRYDAASFSQADTATVEGGVTQDAEGVDRFGVGTDFAPVPGWVLTVYGLLANLLLGVILLAVFPGFSTGVAQRVRDTPIRTGGVGFLTLVGVPFVITLIAITIVGIPLAIVGTLAFFGAIWVGVVYGQYAVGAAVLGLFGQENRWLALVVGLVGFTILGAIPFLGGLLEFLALLLGVGALALGLRHRYRARGERGTGTESQQMTLSEATSDTSRGTGG